jgi:Fe(3+) dicitrate transport protein
MKLIIILLMAVWSTCAYSQQNDSLFVRQLNEVTVRAKSIPDLDRLTDLSGAHIYTAKKNEVINLQSLNANIAEKTGRQIFAKVPGVFVYDMDGSGNQMNISTRGLDPHRGWEFNIRRNGAITNSDMYGYPASHYSIPLEAIERIELVRGTGSLQYGAQFGGMLNYVSKMPDSAQVVSVENITSIGSYGLLSTYLSVGGTSGKFQYQGYYSKRVSSGYRENGQSDYDAQALLLIYSPAENIKLTAELSRSYYLYQIPGPLTDQMFESDPRQSTRSRNYFNPEIYVPSINLDWKLSKRTELVWLTSAVLGNRNSVMFDKPANIKDEINPVTMQYAPRQVDIDNFNSYTSELRLVHRYSIIGKPGSFVAGFQYIHNDLHRRQLGSGTTGTDFDLTTLDGSFKRDIHYKTQNIALFFENTFQLTSALSFTAGFRSEEGKSIMSGVIDYYAQEQLPNEITHKFPLFGFGGEYKIGKVGSFYVGWSQAYRPVILKDIIPSSTYELVDKNLKDAHGYNFELGYRGSIQAFRWDVGLFQLNYNNRLGMQAAYDDANNFYIYRTNIGNSATRGAEIFAEYRYKSSRKSSLSVFTSTALFDAKYTQAAIRVGNTNSDISGNKVEGVPDIITRNGITWQVPHASFTFLYSYVSESFADPMNTKEPSATGAVGLVPAYGLLDFNSTFLVLKNITLRVNVNNITNRQYFTKRPSFYPGPGIWTSDGRSVVVSIGFKV